MPFIQQVNCASCLLFQSQLLVHEVHLAALTAPEAPPARPIRRSTSQRFDIKLEKVLNRFRGCKKTQETGALACECASMYIAIQLLESRLASVPRLCGSAGSSVRQVTTRKSKAIVSCPSVSAVGPRQASPVLLFGCFAANTLRFRPTLPHIASMLVSYQVSSSASCL